MALLVLWQNIYFSHYGKWVMLFKIVFGDIEYLVSFGYDRCLFLFNMKIFLCFLLLTLGWSYVVWHSRANFGINRYFTCAGSSKGPTFFFSLFWVKSNDQPPFWPARSWKCCLEPFGSIVVTIVAVHSLSSLSFAILSYT